MIKSILDTDLYKLSQSFAYFSLYPLAEGTFKFHDRNQESWNRKDFDFLSLMKRELSQLQYLHFTETEKQWCIEHIPYIPKTYWEWLTTFRFEPEKINCWLDENGVFQCEVTDNMHKVTFYEIVILATYSELRNYLLNMYENHNYNEGEALQIFREKIKFANENNLPFAEFGTRRRYSSDLHDKICRIIKEESKTCNSTSNVYLAMKYDLIPTGTMAHEWIMFHAGCFGYKRANYLAMEDWIKVYQGDLGTALIDTYTTNSFLRTLTRQQALLLQGLRQDSGDEIEVGEKIIARYKEFRIDPTTKLIVFSNALDFEKALRVMNYFKGKIKTGFGIGTFITCDPGIVDFVHPNVVMKLSRCRMSPKDPWEDVIKVSDDFGKQMGLKKEFEIAVYQLNLDGSREKE